MQVELEYIGKKEPYTFNFNVLTHKGAWTFRHRGSSVFTSPAIADEVLKHNPTGFVKKIGEKHEPVEMIKEPKSGLDCPYCGKNYKERGRGKYFFERHVETCPDRILVEPEEPKNDYAEIIQSPLDE